jgi:hypothetical protein
MDYKNVGKLIVGVVVFLVVLQVLQMTNLAAFVVDRGVDDGNLAAENAPGVTTALEIGSAILSGVVFLLTRLGTASIAFVTALVGGNAPAQSVLVNPVVAARDDLRKQLAVHMFNKAIDGDREAINVFVDFLAGEKVFSGEKTGDKEAK